MRNSNERQASFASTAIAVGALLAGIIGALDVQAGDFNAATYLVAFACLGIAIVRLGSQDRP